MSAVHQRYVFTWLAVIAVVVLAGGGVAVAATAATAPSIICAFACPTDFVVLSDGTTLEAVSCPNGGCAWTAGPSVFAAAGCPTGSIAGYWQAVQYVFLVTCNGDVIRGAPGDWTLEANVFDLLGRPRALVVAASGGVTPCMVTASGDFFQRPMGQGWTFLGNIFGNTPTSAAQPTFGALKTRYAR